MQEKKKWDKPKLIVLVKAGVEERVLSQCKSGSGGGWAIYQTGCMWNLSSNCQACFTSGS